MNIKKLLTILGAIILLAVMGNTAVAETTSEDIAKWRVDAEQGDATAQNNLGVAYRDGIGVEKDRREAVRLWRKAAWQGNAEAQYNLGLAYEEGKGVVKSEFESYVWYSIAKASGNKDASRKLFWLEGSPYDLYDLGYLLPMQRAAGVEAMRRMEKIENRRKS